MSLPFLPAAPSSLSWTLEVLFELTRHPSRALDSPRTLLPEQENQGHSQVCCAKRGGPRTTLKTTDANLDCAFVENALYFTDPLEFTKKPEGPKIIPIFFMAAATLSAVKNIVVIIFGHPGFIGLFDFVCRFPTHRVEF